MDLSGELTWIKSCDEQDCCLSFSSINFRFEAKSSVWRSRALPRSTSKAVEKVVLGKLEGLGV